VFLSRFEEISLFSRGIPLNFDKGSNLDKELANRLIFETDIIRISALS
jgi:hypothetical protein